MAKYLFQDIARGNPFKRRPGAATQARKWLREKAMGITRYDAKRLGGKGVSTGRISGESVGRMHFFYYDPKHKATLPYYDRFPLIFPIEVYSDRFMGINLHYLPPMARAQLMNALHTVATDKLYDSKTKLNISYSILNSSARYRYFKPCVKTYLYSHCRSRFSLIDPAEWDIAMMLPLARFEKAPEEQVWEESMRSIRKRR